MKTNHIIGHIIGHMYIIAAWMYGSFSKPNMATLFGTLFLLLVGFVHIAWGD
jgi:hypothetical protein